MIVVLVGPLYGQTDSTIQRIIKLGQTDNRTIQWLDELTNRIGGRPIGSSNYAAAVNYAVMRFKEWGLKVYLDSVTTLPIGFNRGPAYGRLLSENGMILHFATPSFTVGTKGVQRGHVLIEPKTQREFDRMKGALKGAWVLISGKNNGWPIDYSESGNQKRMEVRQKNAEIEKQNDEIRRYNWQHRHDGQTKELLPMIEEPALFYPEMVEAGILGVIQASEVPIVAMYDRKNIMNMSWDNLPKVPNILLDEHQYAIIEKMAKERRYFQLEFDIRNQFHPGPVTVYSVIGVIQGNENPDEYVLVGGHLDSYDIATGASDNAAGVAPAMEAARLIMLSGAKPRRTILFTLWAGEEFGLLGSTAWVIKNKEKLPNISAMFNHDSGPTVETSISVPEAMYNDFQAICEPLFQLNPQFPFRVNKSEPTEKPKSPGGTDTAPFIKEDVPAFGFGTDDILGTNFSYREIWHTERDTFEKCVKEYSDQTAIVTAVVVFGVANLDHLLSREGMWKAAQPPTSDKKTK